MQEIIVSLFLLMSKVGVGVEQVTPIEINKDYKIDTNISESILSNDMKFIEPRVDLIKSNKSIIDDEDVAAVSSNNIENKQENIELNNNGKENEKKKESKKEFMGYNANNLLEVSNITEEEMLILLSDTGMSDIAYSIVEAEKKHEVNAIILASLIALESGWGNSDRAVFQNNVSGMGVYSDSSKGYEYSSREESVLDTARQLRENYLTEGAAYYNGLSLKDVNIKYCAEGQWANKINKIANELTGKYKKLIK